VYKNPTKQHLIFVAVQDMFCSYAAGGKEENVFSFEKVHI